VAEAPAPPGVPPRPGPARVSATALGRAYGTGPEAVVALESLSLAIHPGEVLGLVGPSGCGKTTLLLLLAGLLAPSAGSVLVDGRPLRGPCREASVLFQEDTLLPWRAVLDNVLLPAEIRRLPRGPAAARARALLAEVGLAGVEGRYPHQLSGGMRQRVALCRALLPDLPLLLLDEPFAALDALAREEHQALLEALWLSAPRTIVLVTHDVREAVRLSDRVAVMSARPGRILDVVPVDLPRPRTPELGESPELNRLVADVRRRLQAGGRRTAGPLGG
jgi:NitT/TauT family transport system ATP-binding protein